MEDIIKIVKSLEDSGLLLKVMMIIGLYAPLTPTTDSALREVVGCRPQLYPSWSTRRHKMY